MKHPDLTKSVMENVARFERSRSTSWLWRFRITLSTLLVLVLLVLWRVWRQLQESNSLDLLTLFGQDIEIIREFWQDTVSVFLSELPQRALLIAGVIVLVIGCIIWLTRRKRRVIARRLDQLAKRKVN